MQKITRPAFILLLFSVFILIFSSERHILAQAAWRLDADPAAIMPHHFRIDKELQIAGGSQPVPAALRSLPEALGCKDGTSLWIIDLRQESHGFLNGAAVSWHTEKNAANRGFKLPKWKDVNGSSSLPCCTPKSSPRPWAMPTEKPSQPLLLQPSATGQRNAISRVLLATATNALPPRI